MADAEGGCQRLSGVDTLEWVRYAKPENAPANCAPEKAQRTVTEAQHGGKAQWGLFSIS